MYKHILKERGQIFEEGVALPIHAPHVCAKGLNVGNRLGMLACAITASNSVSIAPGKTITVTFLHGDSDGAYGEHSSHAISFADGLDVGPGGVVARMLLPPDARRWIKATLSCDDAAASGALDVFAEYLAR